ncbi:MAG TPA: DUF5662 family protein [Acetobacteraceae bacterium]|nr:DUF5662 family protein [Acetobacteraceae bacterium]
MSAQYDSRADHLAHIHAVRDRLEIFAAELMRRGRVHDASKFSAEEKPVYDAVYPMLRGVAYGSAEWKAAVERARPALDHHYQRNRHHPEYHAEGIAGMDLFDVVEMLCDWMAAAERNPADGVRLDLNVTHYGIDKQLARILENTLARWPVAL